MGIPFISRLVLVHDDRHKVVPYAINVVYALASSKTDTLAGVETALPSTVAGAVGSSGSCTVRPRSAERYAALITCSVRAVSSMSDGFGASSRTTSMKCPISSVKLWTGSNVLTAESGQP